jgi:hypothetical protein
MSWIQIEGGIQPGLEAHPPDDCQICGSPLADSAVDGKTVYGPWAWMCRACHRQIGCGFGMGRGQLYTFRI